MPKIKISADGERLADDAAEWVAVLDERTGLMWAREHIAVPNWREEQVEKTAAALAALTTAGHRDWRIPTVEELFTLPDRTRTSPAIDTTFFPECESEWYWTSTPYAPAPGEYAWHVGFYGGSAGDVPRGNDGFVRAVRAGQRLPNEAKAERDDEIAEAKGQIEHLDRQNNALRVLVTKATDVLSTYIVPDSGLSDDEALNQLLGIFDGPEYRAAFARETEENGSKSG